LAETCLASVKSRPVHLRRETVIMPEVRYVLYTVRCTGLVINASIFLVTLLAYA